MFWKNKKGGHEGVSRQHDGLDQTTLGAPGDLVHSLGQELEPGVSRESMKHMVMAGISNRIDRNGYFTSGYDNIDSAIYNELTGYGEKIKLTSEDIDRIKGDKDAAAKQVEMRGYTSELSTEQVNAAYHIENRAVSSQPDFETVRIYAHAGVDALKVLGEVLSKANIDYAKVWIPWITEDEQHFRSDTPIFEVSRAEDLAAVVTVLRDVHRKGEANFHPTLSAGLAIEGLPGVYVGQCKRGTSFNDRASSYYSNAIRQAITESGLGEGERVTDAWLDAVSDRALALVPGMAEKLGFDSNNPALLKGQPVEKIVNATKAVA